MSNFSETVLGKKLQEVNNSQQSIQTLSLWLIHHRKHHKLIVATWLQQLKKAKDSRKLVFLHLANDVIQQSKKRGSEFCSEFAHVLPSAFQLLAKVDDDKTQRGLMRLIAVWRERHVYTSAFISQLENVFSGGSAMTPSYAPSVVPSKKPKRGKVIPVKVITLPDPPDPPAELKVEANLSPSREPPTLDELIDAMARLENAASCDASVREEIARLPPEVSDMSLLDRVTDRTSGTKLHSQVSSAHDLLVHYNGRLSVELDDRKNLAQIMADYIAGQRMILNEEKHKLTKYRELLKQGRSVKDDMQTHFEKLPDLTKLPDMTGGLAPLPSAGDLFCM